MKEYEGIRKNFSKGVNLKIKRDDLEEFEEIDGFEVEVADDDDDFEEKRDLFIIIVSLPVIPSTSLKSPESAKNSPSEQPLSSPLYFCISTTTKSEQIRAEVFGKGGNETGKDGIN